MQDAFQARAMAVAARDDALSFVASALTEGEVENDWKWLCEICTYLYAFMNVR